MYACTRQQDILYSFIRVSPFFVLIGSTTQHSLEYTCLSSTRDRWSAFLLYACDRCTSRMSFFKLLQKKGSNPIPPAPDSVRRETVHGAPPLRRIPQPNTSRPKSNLPSLQAGVRKVGRAQTDGTRRGHTIRRKHSSQPRLQSDSGSQGSDVELETRVKRKKLAHEDHRPQRNDLRSGTAFAEDDSGELPMVHAAHIASVDKAPKYRPAFPQAVDCSTVMLQYPSASPRETYG